MLLTKWEISFRVASTGTNTFLWVVFLSWHNFIGMDQKLIAFNLSQRRTNLPPVRTGDVIRVTRKIKEGGKERLQVFEGMIIAKKGGQSASQTITVRKISFGIGVEIIFPLNSHQVEKIDFIKRTKAGRSKIYYVRHKSAKVLSRKLKEIPAKDIIIEKLPKKAASKTKATKEKGIKTSESETVSKN